MSSLIKTATMDFAIKKAAELDIFRRSTLQSFKCRLGLSPSHLIYHITLMIKLKYCCYGVKQQTNKTDIRCCQYVKQQTNKLGYITEGFGTDPPTTP